MVKKYVVQLASVVGLLMQTGVFIKEEVISLRVITSLRDVDATAQQYMPMNASTVEVAAYKANSTHKTATEGDGVEPQEPKEASPALAQSVDAVKTSPAEANTPAADDTVSTGQPSSNADKERVYYDYHHQQISQLLNDTTLLDWNRNRRHLGKYRRWLDHFDYHELPKNGSSVDISLVTKDFFRSEATLCAVAKTFHKYRTAHPNTPKPHVLLGRLNQDFGLFSSKIKRKTGRFRTLPDDWIKQGCSEEFVFDYINHPDTLAIFTTQFQKWNHPKVISIPLGLSAGGHRDLLNQTQLYTPAKNRTQFLMVNSNPWSGRVKSIGKIVSNFNGTGIPIHNTYGDFSATACPHDNIMHCYYWEMSTSKFILSPSGFGVDCYRNWEALYTGAIPVMERLSKTDGWFENTLADLPIAWIDDYKDLTPEYLEKEYDRIVYQKPPSAYKFEKLTRQYWIQMAHSIVDQHKQQEITESARRHTVSRPSTLQ